jgi:hypothetical protein
MTPASSLLREARALGWLINAGSRHWRLQHPATGATTILSRGTCSDSSLRNQRARIRSVLRQSQFQP